MGHSPLSVWQAAGFRLTAFPILSAQPMDHDWWTELVGERPEKITSQPKTGQRIEEGSFEDGKLVLIRQPSRIEYQYSVNIEQSPETVTIPTLGSFPEALTTFQELMHRWLTNETIPPLARLAFGAGLLQPVQGEAEIYNLLSQYLHIRLDLEGSSDFLYQINRSRETITGNPDLKINRLSKWSALMVKGVILSLPAASIQETETLFACQLELDMNTAADFKNELPPDQLAKLFDELIDLGKQIADEGDIR